MAENKEKRTIEIIVNGQQANASLKEMNAAAAVLYNQFQKMAADDPGRAKLVADYRAMKDRISDVKTELTGVSQAQSMLKQGFANVFALFTGGGVVAMVQKVWGFLSDAKDEFQSSAKDSADLEATLRSTGHAAGLTAGEIKKIGEERAKVTLFDDDETNRASAMLLTFTNIKKGVFEEAMPAIEDIATKMAGDGPADLKGASIQVGKALNDPIKGITALTRVGVTFTEQQKEQITQMVKSGNTAGAQKLILAELNKEFGGSAEAARKAAGGMATLSMRWGEMKETVGGFVSAGLSKLSEWFGHLLDAAEPIVTMFGEIGDELAALWRDVTAIVDSLGLFNTQFDLAKYIADGLKMTLTLLLAPFRVLLFLSRQLYSGFIDLYNSSQLLRGVLGGLAAVVSSVFTSIKNDALKILGGVGDILVGIFTLDKDKIIAGFKTSLEGTADSALLIGARAAAAFKAGYEANKDNLIVRPVRVEAKEEESVVPSAGKEEPAGESEKERKAREAKEKKAQRDREKAAKLEEELERKHQEMLLNLQEAALVAQGNQRAIDLGRVMLDAERKALAVKGTEEEKNAAIELLMQEALQKQSELQEKWREDDRKKKKDDVDQQLADEVAAELEREAYFLEKFEAALMNQQQYDDILYLARKASLERELALVQESLGAESKEYQKIRGQQLKLERDHHKDVLADAKRTEDEKRRIAQLGLKTAGDVITTTLQLLTQDADGRQKHHELYMALAAAKIMMDGYQEVAAIWKYAAENPGNGITGGIAGTVIGGIQTALAVARTMMALNQLNEVPGYAAGGRTGSGVVLSPNTGMAVSPMGALLEYSGLSVGPDGRLADRSGFKVAGVVHEDEYVIPKWLRQDPQVAAFENWVEAKRMRGFYEGGATSGATSYSPEAGGVVFGTDGTNTTAVLSELVTVMRGLDQRLGGVEAWQRELRVTNNLQGTRAGLDELKQVEQESAIRR